MRRWAGPLAALSLAACATRPALPLEPVPVGPAIRLQVTRAEVAADPHYRQGAFAFRGGVEIRSADTARLHGLSGLHVTPEGALLAVTDEGDLFQARLVEIGGRLVGVTEGRLTPLADLDGGPLQGKELGDAEGLAVLANGDRLVSFEQRHRIWRYPAGGGAPQPAPAPTEDFPANGGMEALAADPSVGPDAYVTAGETAGRIWRCRLSVSCEAGPVLDKPPEFGVVAVRPLPGGRFAWLLRAWDPARGARLELRITDAALATVDRLELARPLAVDNFEGLSVRPLPGGGHRFYLVSDDNFMPVQKTLLYVFDWTP